MALFFCGPRFLNDVFSEKIISIVTAKISDDLFFIYRPGFLDFAFLFPDFPYLYHVKCPILPFPHKKNTFFTLLILSRASDNTTSQNIGGGDGCMGVPTTSNFGGTVPPRSPPLSTALVRIHPSQQNVKHHF